MRRLIPISLVLACFGCKSAEERACAKTVELNEAAVAERGLRDDGKTNAAHRRNCVESLVRLRYELQPSEDQWFTYLRCLMVATSMEAQFDCLGPLTQPLADQPQQSPASKTQPANN